ncbi:MAG: DMT family transporter [Firmicutes bacterium]|nr:DMT family transporter [Bacillota bacterium]
MSNRTRALISVMIGNTIFGFSFIFSKLALQITLPSVMIAVRFLMAFAALNLIAFFGRKIMVSDGEGGRRPLVEFSLKGKPLGSVLLLALFQPILYFLCESYGIVYTSAAFAGTIIAVIPVAGIIFDVVIMHSRVRARQVICAVLSAVGVAITTIGAVGMRSSLLGLVILLGAVCAGALFYVFSKKSGEHFNALEQTYVMFAAGSLVYAVFALVQCRGRYDELIFSALAEPRFILPVLYLAILSSVVAFIFLNYGTVRVTVSEAAIFANLTTVISIVAGVVFLHETFTPFQIAGALIIIGSVYVANRTKGGSTQKQQNT